MSGVEVVGIVLAVIPLVISGAEHYGEGMRTISRIRRYKEEFETLKTMIQIEQIMLQNALAILLMRFWDLDQVPISRLGSEVWATSSMNQCFRQGLGEQYELFIVVATLLKKALYKLKTDLHINDNGKVAFITDKWSFPEAIKRIKFGINHKAHQELLEDIRMINSRLRKLAKDNMVLAPRRRIGQLRGVIPDFDRIRRQATSVFGSLQKGLSDNCIISHKASLHMKMLGAPQQEALPFHQVQGDEVFRVVLHHKDSEPTPADTSPWTVEEAEIKPLPAPLDAAGRTTITQRTVHFRPVHGSAMQQTEQHNRVREIKDLCSSLKRLRKTGHDRCLGYLEDADATHRHGLWWPLKPLTDRSLASNALTFSNMLSQRQLRLQVADRSRLALALVMGMLRLHNTPWLQRQWGCKEILLFRSPKGIVFDRPFISIDIKGKSQPERESNPSYFKRCKLIRNETIFALAILLIEICLCQPFHKMVTPQDLKPGGQKHQISDFLTARRLVDTVHDEVGRRWSDIVRRCIHCDFLPGKYDLRDKEFRDAVYEKLVIPLEKEVSIIQGEHRGWRTQ